LWKDPPVLTLHRSKKGLDLPIAGEPDATLDVSKRPTRVAIVGEDYPGLRPTMFVKLGDTVRTGQLLFEDKTTAGVRHTSPGTGTIRAIHRGERRSFQSIVVELSGAAEAASFSSFRGTEGQKLSRSEVRDLLLESGEWTALRARPFGRVADPAIVPHSIFVTAVDTNPLAPEVDAVLASQSSSFERGLHAIATLTEGPVFVCTSRDTKVGVPGGGRFRHERFQGPHPSGTVGYHIHRLDPVDRKKTVWYVGCQDVAAIGHLFETGTLQLERVVSLAGPAVRKPRLLRIRRGAWLDELVAGELAEGETRVISGSVLSGRRAMGETLGYLGRYHSQVSALAEYRGRDFLGWLTPGLKEFSVQPAFLSSLFPGTRFAMNTSTHGSRRAIVPLGSYEKVTPFDILPTFLVRALAMKDAEKAEALGCLELEEEDVALLSFVDVGKTDFGVLLRDVLTTIEKEG
jgi:Na+-transporting NADH:ubiquinone oxidoreductase subunit A